MDELLIAFGSEVKAVGDGKIEGYLCRFSTSKDPDLEGEFFTKDTDFGIHSTLPLYYQHGFDGRLKGRRIGAGDCRKDDVGIWYEAQMEMRDDYEKMIYEMIQAGKLGYSSGAISHRVEREQVGKSFWLKAWPLGEASMTPTPAEPRNRVLPCKTYFDDMNGDSLDLSDCTVSTRTDNLPSVTFGGILADTNTPQLNFRCFKQAPEEIKTVRQFEEFLRDAGFPNAAAVTIASKGFNALRQRDSEDDDTAELSWQMRLLLSESQLKMGVPHESNSGSGGASHHG